MDSRLPESITLLDITRHYLNFAQLSDWVRETERLWPRWVRLSSLGDSHEGRALWCLTVTDFEKGTDLDRSALWVDGNLHASELSGTNACLHLVQELVEKHRDLLGEVAFYIVPRVCPDGAELALAGDPRFLRSSVRPYPFADPVGSGIEPSDVDGNGKLLFEVDRVLGHHAQPAHGPAGGIELVVLQAFPGHHLVRSPTVGVVPLAGRATGVESAPRGQAGGRRNLHFQQQHAPGLRPFFQAEDGIRDKAT